MAGSARFGAPAGGAGGSMPRCQSAGKTVRRNPVLQDRLSVLGRRESKILNNLRDTLDWKVGWTIARGVEYLVNKLASLTLFTTKFRPAKNTVR